MTPGIAPDFNRLADLVWTHPVLTRIREDADLPVYLVGGAIRDGLADFRVDDLDLVVEGDPVPLARRLDPGLRVNERFGTVNLRIDGFPVDIATARTETYSRPGALPDVTPGSLADDLGRRDFTINAMAMAITGEAELVDPFGGLDDLSSGVIRVLHDGSFVDDPTRALRAARYSARFGFDLDPRTAELMMDVNPGSVSRERIENELSLIAEEETAVDGLRLARLWGLVDFDESRLEVADRASALLETEPWRGETDRRTVILAAVFGPVVDGDLAPGEDSAPHSDWDAFRRARGRDPVELVVARAQGATWLDRWQRDLRWVELEITGADLLAAGVPEGPRIGRGLDAALEAKLTRGVRGPESEMAVALAAAGVDR